MMQAIRIARLALLFCGLFIIDRITKVWALNALAYDAVSITSFLQLELVFNKGISWGMLTNDAGWTYHLITLFIGAIIIALIGVIMHRYKQQPVWPEIMVLAGAISNIIDRIYYHGVIDFIAVSYGTWSFPVFNVADCYIVIGVFIMAYYAHWYAHE